MKPFPVYFSLQKIQTEDVLFYFNIVKSGALLVYSLKKKKNLLPTCELFVLDVTPRL